MTDNALADALHVAITALDLNQVYLCGLPDHDIATVARNELAFRKLGATLPLAQAVPALIETANKVRLYLSTISFDARADDFERQLSDALAAYRAALPKEPSDGR